MYYVMCASALWIVHLLFQMWNGEDEITRGLNATANSMQMFTHKNQQQKSLKPIESVQGVLTSVTPEYVQNQYVRTQERFRSHSSIFLRECVNLTQRKNSITIEYQRGVTARFGSKPSVSSYIHSGPKANKLAS